MYDMLPYPNISATTAEEQAAQINNYLIQFKETLEFILTNITTENLSPSLVDKLNNLGLEIEKTTEDTTDQIQQVSSNAITVSDVINSQAFNAALDSAVPHKYLVSVEQIWASQESGGINVYGFEDATGTVNQLIVRNGAKGDAGPVGAKGDTGARGEQGIQGEKGEKGDTPNVTFTVNFTTGNLEYTTS